MISGFADELCHGAHRTINTPAARLKQNHGNKAKNGGCKHNTVEAKGKLSNARMNEGSVICPMPGDFKSPKKSHNLSKILCAGKYQVGIPEHLEEHGEKENQKSITEPFTFHPFRNIFFSGKTEATSQKAE